LILIIKDSLYPIGYIANWLSTYLILRKITFERITIKVLIDLKNYRVLICVIG